jgi:ribosomal protein S18 acetylase RimI-like enzyme
MTILANDTCRASARTMPRLLRPVRFIYGRAASRKHESTLAIGGAETLLVRRAQLQDMPAIIGLIDEASRWLGREVGTDQWQRPWPDRAARDQRIYRGIKSDRTWMVEDPSRREDDPHRLVATVTCGRGGNKKLWKQPERNEPALYISRLIVSRRQAGRGVGAGLINWAGLRGRASGAEFIRIDVWTTNYALQNYYKAQGFSHVRTCDFDDPWDYPSAALFQKSTNEIDVAAAARFLEV